MNLNILSVSPSQAWEVMKQCYAQRQTLMLHGGRGVGKTALTEQFSQEIVKGPLYKILLTQIENVDLRGLVFPDEKTQTTRWFPPEFLPRTNTPAVMFFDELTAAETRLQKSAYQLLLERRIGTYQVPESVFMIAAGNTGDDGAIVSPLDAPAADRMVHVKIQPSVPDWIKWAQQNQIAPAIVAYIKHRPEHLDGLKEQIAQDQLLGPSPRAWARLSQFVTANPPRTTLEILTAGILGEAIAASFLLVFDEITSQASIQDILDAPENKREKLIPRSIAGLYNLCYSMAAMVTDKKSLGQVLEVCGVLSQIKGSSLPLAEIETLAMELIMDKASRLPGGNNGMIPYVVTTAAYKRYDARRQAKGL